MLTYVSQVLFFVKKLTICFLLVLVQSLSLYLLEICKNLKVGLSQILEFKVIDEIHHFFLLALEIVFGLGLLYDTILDMIYLSL